MTVKVRPAIVSVPVRSTRFGLAATLKATEPLPEPEPPVTVIQAALDAAVHVQPLLLASTLTESVPPSAATAALSELRLYSQAKPS